VPKGIKGFQKGHKSFHTPESKIKISRYFKGKYKGKHLSINSEFKKGHKGYKYWLGKKREPFSEEAKRKISESNKGNKSHWWKGGITTYERKLYLNRMRRCREIEAPGFHTFEEWELLKKQYGFQCPMCGKSEPQIKLSEDHIIPLTKGGSNYIENIQPLCRSCNSKKNTKIIDFRKDTII
jgi:5-methylcytosine-specific restriction endonuclease McrA